MMNKWKENKTFPIKNEKACGVRYWSGFKREIMLVMGLHVPQNLQLKIQVKEMLHGNFCRAPLSVYIICLFVI